MPRPTSGQCVRRARVVASKPTAAGLDDGLHDPNDVVGVLALIDVCVTCPVRKLTAPKPSRFTFWPGVAGRAGPTSR